MTWTRMAPAARQEQLLDAAVEVALQHGWDRITQHLVAQRAGCSPALVIRYWSTVAGLKESVMRAAIRREVVPIIAQGMAIRDAAALAAPEAVRVRAAAWLMR